MPEIEGGSDLYAAAAVMAAVQVVLEEMEAAGVESSLQPGAWVLAGRPRSVVGPRTDFSGLRRRRERGEHEKES